MAALAGITLVQALGLPSLLTRGGQFVALSVAAPAVCLALSVALALAPADESRPLWRAVAAASVGVLGGWALPHAAAVPRMADRRAARGAPPPPRRGARAA